MSELWDDSLNLLSRLNKPRATKSPLNELMSVLFQQVSEEFVKKRPKTIHVYSDKGNATHTALPKAKVLKESSKNSLNLPQGRTNWKDVVLNSEPAPEPVKETYIVTLPVSLPKHRRPFSPEKLPKSEVDDSEEEIEVLTSSQHSSRPDKGDGKPVAKQAQAEHNTENPKVLQDSITRKIPPVFTADKAQFPQEAASEQPPVAPPVEPETVHPGESKPSPTPIQEEVRPPPIQQEIPPASARAPPAPQAKHTLKRKSNLADICSKTNAARFQQRVGLSKRVRVDSLHTNIRRK